MLMTTFIIFGWLALLLILWVWQHELLRRTWREPYFAVPPVVIESDDWGPGGEHHAERLRQLLRMLARHRDCRGQPAILTANIVLAVPDTKAICANGYSDIVRRWLDTDFPDILEVMREGQDNRTFDPQLHGLEHLHTPGLMRLAREGDGEARRIFDEPDWWDWESLSSPRQAHYVDGTQLPTVPLNREDRVATVDEAIRVFQRCFGFAPRSTVAPCYLWDAEVEDIWRDIVARNATLRGATGGIWICYALATEPLPGTFIRCAISCTSRSMARACRLAAVRSGLRCGRHCPSSSPPIDTISRARLLNMSVR